MSIDDVVPLISNEELKQTLAEDGPLPFVSLLEPNMESWDDIHQKVFEKISESANGDRLFTTLSGHLDEADFESVFQAELQVVEFIRFYGGIFDTSRDTVETISKNAIQASPISEPNNEIWSDSAKAEIRVSYLYDTLIELDTAGDANEDEEKDKPLEPTPQNLDKLNMGMVGWGDIVRGTKNDELLGK